MKRVRKYGLGGTIGGIAGTAISLIPGVGPVLKAVASPALGALGNAIDKGISAGMKKPEEEQAAPTLVQTNNYSGVKSFRYGGGRLKPGSAKLVEIKGPPHEQGGVPLKNKNGKVVGEVEGDETKVVQNEDPTFVFSDSLKLPNGSTFADESKKYRGNKEKLEELANLQENMKSSNYKGGARVYEGGGEVLLDIAQAVAPTVAAAVGSTAYKTPRIQRNRGFEAGRALLPKEVSLDSARQDMKQSELNANSLLKTSGSSRGGIRSAITMNRANTIRGYGDIAMKEQMGNADLAAKRAAFEVSAGADEQAVANQQAMLDTEASNAKRILVSNAINDTIGAAVGINKDRKADQYQDDSLAMIAATSRRFDPKLLGRERYERLFGVGSYDTALGDEAEAGAEVEEPETKPEAAPYAGRPSMSKDLRKRYTGDSYLNKPDSTLLYNPVLSGTQTIKPSPRPSRTVTPRYSSYR